MSPKCLHENGDGIGVCDLDPSTRVNNYKRPKTLTGEREGRGDGDLEALREAMEARLWWLRAWRHRGDINLQLFKQRKFFFHRRRINPVTE
jgi:hypothetical protein